MAGIYIHIPFCKKACHYCNFHFSTSLYRKPELIRALLKEIEATAFPVNMEMVQPAETIYFGGGTPSLLTPGEIESILGLIHKRFNVAEHAEITLEANPDDITHESLTNWKLLGINRLSIGIQSFRQQDLEWMNRAHHARQALDCIELAQAKSFNNLNIDLIFGTPTLDNDAWLSNLEMTEKMGITHLSAYALTIEEKTALHYFIEKGKVPAPSEDKQAEQFEILMNWAEATGWDHYEISNLCRPGHFSRHNTNYWSGNPYIGFGPSAHSFDGKKTRWNGIANNAKYMDAWLGGSELPYEMEILTEFQQLNEKIMTGLRTKKGISLHQTDKTIEGFSIAENVFESLLVKIKGFEHNGWCLWQKDRLLLTGKGRLYADFISSELFL